MKSPLATNRCRDSARNQFGDGHATAGFTLVELVLVLTLVGILAAVTGPRFFDRGTFDERGYFDELSAALRYGQKVAVATGCPVRVSITPAGYALAQQDGLGGHCDPADTAYANPVRLPDGQTMDGMTPAGIVVVPAVGFRFLPTGSTDLPGDQNLNIGARTLLIVADSGLVTTP